MAAIDSAAVFENRLVELGIPELAPKFRELLLGTYGSFGYAVPVAPGGAFDAAEFRRDVLEPILGVGPEDRLPPQAAVVRRLFHEAHALALGDLRSRVERTDADPPKRLPQVEREARRAALNARLGLGIQVEGENEPAHSIVDRYTHMLEEDRLEYVPWACVASRSAELKVGATRRRWLPSSSGFLREVETRDAPQADVSSHWLINAALTRRSMAVDMAGIMSFSAHETLRAKLMKALTEPTGDPAYSPPSIDRVKAADEYVWQKLASACARGLRARTAADTLPADVALAEILGSMEFALRVGPLPALSGVKTQPRQQPGAASLAAAASSDTAHGGGDAEDKKNKRKKKKKHAQDDEEDAQQEIKRLRAELQRFTAKGNGPKGGGKGDGKGDRKGLRVPEALRPGQATLGDGRRICFGYNLGTCDACPAGQQCARGLHLCTKIGCQGAHRARDCPR